VATSEPGRDVKNRPRPKPGREAIPVPAGEVFYESLKSSFIDFGRLVTNLEKEGFTGYVRLLTEDAVGLILFQEGTTLECMYQSSDDPKMVLGKRALKELHEAVARGNGVLDVISLSAELINGLYALAVSKPMYSDLYAAWVDIGALLQFLHERRLSGSVLIRAKAGTGVIVLAEGDLAGAFTSESPEIAEPDRALALCEDPNATIEVTQVDSIRHQPLGVEEAIAALPADPSQEQDDTASKQPDVSPELSAAMAVTTSNQPSFRGTGTLLKPPTQLAAGPEPDWVELVAELQDMAGNALGHRARKVKDLLAFADPTQTGIEAAIDQIPYLVILFVDSARMEHLAQDMRARLKPQR
jgi:hypothetical protein